MTLQVFDISDPAVFREFSSVYKIFREVLDSGLLGLEIRNLNSDSAHDIFKIILEEKEICYRTQPYTRESDLFIPGTMNQLKNFARRVISSGYEDIGYKIAGTIKNFEEYDNISYYFGPKEFRFNKPYIMGILNVTPDSFSDGGLFLNSETAISHGIEMINEGADFIDVGGESTRPGSDPVTAEEEIKRVLPVIQGILKKHPDALISIDTNKSIVAQKALEMGAAIINDISGLTFDTDMIDVAKRYKASVVIMHIKGRPKTMQEQPVYEDVVKDVYSFLSTQSKLASKSGIKNIIVDPGIGFGKTAEHNLQLIKRLGDFKCLGYPILVGVSRKAFIGKITGADIDERDPGTSITESAAILRGARIIRTHNVKLGRYTSRITEKLI